MTLGLVVHFPNKLRHLPEVSLQRIARHVLPYLVLEVGEEAKAIVKLHKQGLIVVSHPLAEDAIVVAVVKISTLTEARLGREIGVDHDLPCVLVLEGELVLAADDLYAIWDLVRAHLLGLEEVHNLGVSRHVERPPLVMKLLAQAVDRLVRPHPAGHHVYNQKQYCHAHQLI